MNTTEQELLERLLKGDEEAFAALYRGRHGAICRFALQMTGRRDVAEDVTQETFLALALHGKRYDARRGSVIAFLYGIARNLVLKRLEQTRPEEELPDEFAGGEDLLGDLTRRESIYEVRRAVLSLPTAYREAVVLCELGEARYEDAAFALGCPVGTVRSRLSRARAMLAKKLAQAGCVLLYGIEYVRRTSERCFTGVAPGRCRRRDQRGDGDPHAAPIPAPAAAPEILG